MKAALTGLKSSAFKLLSRGDFWIPRSELDLKHWNEFQKPALCPIGEHWFFYSPTENIALKRLGTAERFWPGQETPRHPIATEEAFVASFGNILKAALVNLYIEKRKLLGDVDHCFRWVFADSDGMPGVLIDVFDDVLVLKFQNQAAQFFGNSWRQFVAAAFEEVRGFSPKFSEDHTQEKSFSWNSFQWWMNPGGDQKTGAYFDQRFVHKKLAALAEQLGFQKAWDLCSFHGGFSMHLLKSGLEVLAVDVSKDALQVAQRNVQLNNLPVERFQTQQQDVFEFLRERAKAGDQMELVSLDPPSMLKNPKEKFDALRGYLELNLRAMKCLKPGGVLASFSCSHFFTREDFEKMLRQAAHDARKNVRILESMGPAPDHTYRVEFPQGHYFQGWFIQNVKF